jgi:VPDSG-CTERM motif
VGRSEVEILLTTGWRALLAALLVLLGSSAAYSSSDGTGLTEPGKNNQSTVEASSRDSAATNAIPDGQVSGTVPDSGSTVMLLGMALLGIWWLSRRSPEGSAEKPKFW